MTNPKEIPENEINARVAEAQGWECGSLGTVPYWVTPFSRTELYPIEEYRPLTDSAQLGLLLMDNWEWITAKLDEWFTYCDDIGGLPGSLEWLWWEHSEYLANKELWILRALVAYKEDKE